MRFGSRRVSKRWGLTVTEVLITMTILIIISAVFIMLFSQARSSTEGGSERIELRGTHREAQVRIAQLLRSAIAPNEVDPAILVPEFDETEEFCRFHAPANFLDPAEPFTPRTPNYPEFVMDLYPVTGQVHLQLSDGTGPLVRLGREFTGLEFHRDGKRIITVTLTSTKTIRSISSSPKEVVETSQNKIMLPGVP